MLVFLDESGDPGMLRKPGASKLFLMGAVLFENYDAAHACDVAIDALRQRMGLNPRFEFHFNSCKRAFREQFLEAVRDHQFLYHVFALDKQGTYEGSFSNKNSLYQFTTRMVFENIQPLLREATITFDEYGDRQFKYELQRYLKQTMISKEGMSLIKKVKMNDSCSNNLLQLADMVCGAVARSYREDKDDRNVYQAIIKRRKWRPRV